YVPLDPAYPAERLRLMLEDSGALAVVTQTALAGRLAEIAAAGPAIVELERAAAEISRQQASPPPPSAAPANLAYLIYTSGSTGRPKGVAIEHRSLANFAAQAVGHYGMTAADRVLQCSSISWDTSAEEIYPTLASGGALLLRDPEMLDSARGFLERCREWRLTVLNLASAFWHELMIDPARDEINQLAALRLVIIGGERANPERVALWHRHIDPRIRLMNTYGASEATAITTTYDLTANRAAGPFQEVPIGQPFPGVETLILDDQLQPAADGELGTLHIGGLGLGRGYLSDPALTAAKFIPHPWAPEPGARLYCTGDLARWREDGAIEYFGRRDHQVKIRGHRIALGEIEAALCQHPLVRDAIVLAREDQPGRSYLAAYVVAEQGAAPAAAELSAHLAGRLPAYMLPAAFVALPALPLTPNGKLDRRALPKPAQIHDAGHETAYTATEAALATIWRELLDLPAVDPAASFFDLGGHSLLAMHLIGRARDALGAELSLQDLLAYPTLGELALLIDGGLARPAAEDIDFAAEAQLDPDIGFAGLAPAAGAQRLLLTGATGFLGAFLLAELARQPGAEIWCLARAASDEAAGKRIEASLRGYGLWHDGLAGSIRPLAGDLGQPLLGLDAARFADLAETIDVIYHNGAAVNFVYPYRALKAANVLGTQEAIRLAGTARLKQLHFISTLAVAEAAAGGEAEVAEETALPAIDSDSGYVQSKWVAERLVLEARRRGLPASIYRPDRIAGDSRSGASNGDDFFFRLLAGCAAMGAAPALELRERMLPVDFVSQAIAAIARQPEALGQAFHLFHDQPAELEAALQALESAGRPVARLPYAEWRARLLAEAAAPDHPLYAFRELFPADPAELDGLGYHAGRPVSRRNADAALRRAGLDCPPLDAATLEAYAREALRQSGPR
ncbi:MAG TPA: amino acid adenylation domain-containing protein, partial [Herpetosiphonaceae bacterium]